MIFKPNILVLVQRNGLLIAGKRTSSSRLNFPDDVAHNLEILQRAKLVELCRQFFIDKGLKGKRVIIVLDYSVVFEKVIELDQTGKPDLLMQGFVDAMPFDTGKRTCIALQTNNNLRLFAANAELYETVDEALHAAGASAVQAITPIAAYDLSDNERTIRAAAERILKDSTISKQANFHDTISS